MKQKCSRIEGKGIHSRGMVFPCRLHYHSPWGLNHAYLGSFGVLFVLLLGGGNDGWLRGWMKSRHGKWRLKYTRASQAFIFLLFFRCLFIIYELSTLNQREGNTTGGGWLGQDLNEWTYSNNPWMASFFLLLLISLWFGLGFVFPLLLRWNLHHIIIIRDYCSIKLGDHEGLV